MTTNTPATSAPQRGVLTVGQAAALSRLLPLLTEIKDAPIAGPGPIGWTPAGLRIDDAALTDLGTLVGLNYAETCALPLHELIDRLTDLVARLPSFTAYLETQVTPAATRLQSRMQLFTNAPAVTSGS